MKAIKSEVCIYAAVYIQNEQKLYFSDALSNRKLAIRSTRPAAITLANPETVSD